MSREDVVAALVAERYAPPTWWKTPPPNRSVIAVTAESDTEIEFARRRRVLLAAADGIEEESA